MMWQPNHLSREQLTERRREGARLLRQGRLSQAEIARQLGASRMAVCKWAKQLKSAGLRGLAARPTPGRPPQLTLAQWRQVLRLLKRGARRAGFESERWTLPRIQRVVHQEFGVRYSQSYLSRRLRALGWSRQQPVARALERDDALVTAWLKRDWPRIKKKHDGVVL